MKNQLSRRRILRTISGTLAGIFSLSFSRKAKAAVQKLLVASHTPKGYDPTKHKWLMALDVDRCIGCGLCVEACKAENNVPLGPCYFRTWIERYVITKPEPGSGELRGEIIVDSPNGGMNGFPPIVAPKEQILKAF